MKSSQDVTTTSATSNSGDFVICRYPNGDKDTVKKSVWWKFDVYVLPVTILFYFFSWLDRTNVGNAQVAGLQHDLGLTSVQYSTALTVTFIPYVLTEIPSNLLLKIIGPNILLPALLTCWGITTITQGFVYNYAGLLACRFFIGFFEGGVLPGIVLYLSGFYPRNLLQLRLAIVFSSVSLSGAFSGLLASAISRMHGVGGRPGWAWIFILEGILTVIFGILAFGMLPSCPNKATFLSQEEKEDVMECLKMSDATTVDDDQLFSWREVGETFKLPHVWLMAFSAFFGGIGTFALGYFTPTLVHSLGFSPIRTQLMTVPPYAAAFAATLYFAFIGDKYQARGFTCLLASFCSVTGFAMYLGSTARWTLYGSLFLTISGTTGGAPAHLAWLANNTSPHIRRATGIAVSAMIVNSSGILSTWLFGYLSGPPRYTEAMMVLLISSVLGVILTTLTFLYLWDQNKRKAKKRAILRKEDELHGLGNRSVWFIYIL